MSLTDLFLAFDGRLDRDRWIAAAGLLIGLILGTFVVTWMGVRGGWLSPAMRDMIRAFVQVFVLLPWLSLDWKRFQDADDPGLLALICPGLYALARLLELPLIERAMPGHEQVALGLAGVQVAVAIWLVYVLAFRSGTPGENRFGPDPRKPLVSTGPSGRDPA